MISSSIDRAEEKGRSLRIGFGFDFTFEPAVENPCSAKRYRIFFLTFSEETKPEAPYRLSAFDTHRVPEIQPQRCSHKLHGPRGYYARGLPGQIFVDIQRFLPVRPNYAGMRT